MPPSLCPTARRRTAARLGAAGVALAVGTALGGACVPATPTRASLAADTVHLGATGARRNPNDQSLVRGVTLAVAQLNAERRPGTRPFGLRLTDVPRGHGTASQVAVAAQLRDDSAVVAVVGPTGSAAVLDAAPVFADVERGGARAVAAVTPSASNPAVARSSPWVFRLCPSDDDAAAALARFAADSLRVPRVAVVFRNDLFGRGFTGRVAPELEARGVRVVERDPYLAGVTRYEAYAARLARRRTEAVLVAGNGTDAAAVVRAVHAADARPAVLGTDDVAQMAGSLAGDPAMHGVYFVSFVPPPGAGGADSAAADFARRYREAYGAAPDHRAVLSYDAALLAGRLAAGALADGVRGAQALRRAVRDRLARVGREDPAFVGAGGPVRFDADGGATGRPVWIGRVGG